MESKTIALTWAELIARQTRFEKQLNKELKRIRAVLVRDYRISRPRLSFIHSHRGGIIACGGSVGIAKTVMADPAIKSLLCQNHYTIGLAEKSSEGQYGIIYYYASLQIKQDPRFWDWDAAETAELAKPQVITKPILAPARAAPVYTERGIDDADLPWWSRI